MSKGRPAAVSGTWGLRCSGWARSGAEGLGIRTVSVQSRTAMAITGCYYPPFVPSATNRLPLTPRLSSPHHVRNVLLLLLLVMFTASGCARLNGKIGRAHVCTPVTNAHIVCRLL